ncbi:unnamed protein product [Cuscuta epithymum]|uniref:Homeobox domain-containing protein n=1 Tax=Cuscuta epithymum TaxID=186058 RepID=A0AAV0FC29_9ASTE|nr:unnamed protein product [Cuscuta epithymum]
MYYQGGSEIQGDGLQTLYLMNPNYIGYSDNALHAPPPPQAQPPSAMMFLNSGHALNGGGMPHARVSQSQHFVGVPLQPTGQLHHDPNRNMWTAVEQSQLPSAGGTTDFASQLGFHRSGHQQGLSLSLSPQHHHQHQQQQQQQQQTFRSLPVESPVGLLSARPAAESFRDSGASSSSIIMGSKYLKAAQELLHEVVNVEKSGLDESAAAHKERVRMNRESMSTCGGDPATTIGGENRTAAELSPGHRQELQMKKAKLLSMLDEVEQRDRQYNHQMQVMVASFEQAAGLGSAKAYTQLALKTISKQFRSLKLGIAAQIKAAVKSLGEECGGEQAGGLLLGGASSSRLLRFGGEQRAGALPPHFGMVQPNAWRPQRGLPERAVSVLRAWLFEHFLHPYPKDSDKIMLAKQTGLTRSQVSNWFINARVRLWKPMVEEMYTEEMKGQDQQPLNGKEEINKATKRNQASKDINAGGGGPAGKPSTNKSTDQDPHHHHTSPTADIKNSTNSMSSPCGGVQPPQGCGGAFSFMNMENNSSAEIIRNGKKPRNDLQSSPRSSIVSVDMDEMNSPSAAAASRGYNHKFTTDRQTSAPGNYPDLLAAAANTSGFGGFSMADFGRPFSPENLAAGFHGNNGSVSLTLGLPPSENQQSYLSNPQDMDLGRRLEMGRMGMNNNSNNPQSSSHSNINGSYETIDFENAGKRFAAQLLPDFVA